MNFGQKLRNAREKQGISLGELSRLTGINKSSLQRYETGKTAKIPAEAISILENTLNLPKGYLMKWEQDLNVIVDALQLAEMGIDRGSKINIKDFVDSGQNASRFYDFSNVTPEVKEGIEELYEDYMLMRHLCHNSESTSNDPFFEAIENLDKGYHLAIEADKLEKEANKLKKQSKEFLKQSIDYFSLTVGVKSQYKENKYWMEHYYKNLKKALEEFRIKDDPEKNNP